MQEILDAFEGTIEPVPVTWFYRITVVLVTGVMLLLPIVYVLLIAAAAGLTYYHATAHTFLLRRVGNIWILLFGYVGPLLAGIILVFFMIKPLFARQAKAGKLRSLEFGQEPLLFAIVTRIARAVRAPEPKRIDVDCQVNATASFGSGLGGLFGRDLVLTIGLPLVAGLSVQQLAGVVAHELGHFSQGVGMRLTYLIRSVNAWFARVVYERDDWDEALVNWSEESGRLALIFYLARCCVWVTRGILWLLMMLGHALTCLLLRQMEYDADRYEVRVAGSSNFAETSRWLAVLGVAANATYALLGQAWHRGAPLPDDLSVLIAYYADEIPPTLRRRLEKEWKKTKTGLFDTHPAYQERVSHARAEKAPGIFHLDWPAARLFADFPKLTRAVTRDFYRQVFGRRVNPNDLVPAAALLPSQPKPREEGGRSNG